MVFVNSFGKSVGFVPEDHAFVIFDDVFKIVDVDELDVKLVVEMIYVEEVLFGERFSADFFEGFFCELELVAVISEDLAPFLAFGREL